MPIPRENRPSVRFPALPSRRGAAARSVATFISGVFAAAVVATVVFFVVRPSGAPAASPAAQPPSEIADLLEPGTQSGKGMTIQIADKQDPTRLAAEVLAARYDPDGPMHRKVEEPRAWLFGEDGSSWYIEADRGRFFIPEGTETPSEGYLEGNVRARRYEPVPDGRPEPGVSEASLTATTDEPLRFNLEMLHFETEGRLEITSEELEFAGRGAYVVLNEQRETISALRVDRGERLVFTPASAEAQTEPVGQAGEAGEMGGTAPMREAEADPASPESESTRTTRAKSRTAEPAVGPDVPSTEGTAIADSQPQTPVPAPVPAADPKIDVYEIVFEDRVELVAGTRSVSSDLLTVWVRLVNNKIPERSGGAGVVPGLTGAGGAADALAALALAMPGGPVVSESAKSAASADATDPADASDMGDAEIQTAAPEPIVLTWDGPLEVSPRGDDTEMLSMGDDVALRFEEEEAPVRFEDSSDGAWGRAASAFYFAGRERIELLGPGRGVELVSPNAGRIQNTSKLAIEMGSGLVAVPGPGQMLGRDHDDTPGAESPQQIEWTESAEFRFAVEDGRMGDRLERASFAGGVVGTNRDAALHGSRLDALFDSEPGGDARLVQLNVADARADDGNGGKISGGELEVHFKEGENPGDLDPTRAIIRGDAFARQEGRSSIRAELIDATLARDEADDGPGDIIVTLAEAEGSVEFDDGAGVAGRGESLWADALEEKAVISGEGARVQRDGTVITGPRIDLDGKARRLAVDGPGSFSHPGSADQSGGRSIETAWTERMRFDDRAGSVECVGGVTAETVDAERTRDTVKAARVVMELDPLDGDTSQAGSADTNPGTSPDTSERLRRAIAFGTAETPAVVESRRVAPDSPRDAPRVDELFRLEGAEIRFAARDNRLEVPTAGRLFMLDRRPDGDAGDRSASEGTPLAAPGGRRGTSLFTWDGSLVFDRAIGRATFERNVRAANKPLGASALTDVTAHRLIAAFRAGDGSNTASNNGLGSAGGELLWAEATGNAVLTVEGQREIYADRLLYDADGREIRATGQQDSRVRVRDLMRGSTSTFSAMKWDMTTDTIEFIQPGSIVTPE